MRAWVCWKADSQAFWASLDMADAPWVRMGEELEELDAAAGEGRDRARGAGVAGCGAGFTA